MLKLRCATNQEDDCKFQFVEDMDMEGESGDEIKVERENYRGNYNSYELMRESNRNLDIPPPPGIPGEFACLVFEEGGI